MPVINDLEPLWDSSEVRAVVIAVGWLGPDSEFQRGSVSSEFYRRLCELAHLPWQPVVTAGMHQCEICQFGGPVFSGDVYVPYDDRIYVAPVGIAHYVAAHRYRPPQVFIDAVMQCPPTHSMEYKKAFLANGGRPLLALLKQDPTCA